MSRTDNGIREPDGSRGGSPSHLRSRFGCVVWAIQIAVILQLFAFGTATSSAGTAIPSTTPTATPTPVPLGGNASGFNGVTGDCNENALVSIDELVRGVNIALDRQALSNCPAFDANNNGRVTVDELVLAVGIALRGAPPTFTPTHTPTEIPSDDLVTLVGSSPAHGESGVAVTRETVLRFDGPLDPSTVTAQSIAPVYGGGGLFARLHVAPDGRSVTLFYEVFLPASARVRVLVNGGFLRDATGVAVDADGDGQPGGVAIIDFDTLNLTTLPGTAVCGRVFASHLISGENGTSMNVPLEGVTIEVDGAAGELNTVTDQFGNFRLEPAPVGRFFVFIRGKTATVGVPLGAYYPDVGKAWESVAGVETTIGDIFLPLIEVGTLQPVSATSDTVIRFPDSVRQEFPELADVQLTVPADSLFDRTGTRGGMVGIAPVAPDRIPSRLPPGLDFPLVITVQTDGADRNGNRLAFAYDGAGRLVTITDTLDRNITVAYNADGFIDSVTDFIGRQVRYQYYQDGDADGSFGDLKSVRSPIVTGTPNGNDFPNGKLTTYTYSTGFTDDRLRRPVSSTTAGARSRSRTAKATPRRRTCTGTTSTTCSACGAAARTSSIMPTTCSRCAR